MLSCTDAEAEVGQLGKWGGALWAAHNPVPGPGEDRAGALHAESPILVRTKQFIVHACVRNVPLFDIQFTPLQ